MKKFIIPLIAVTSFVTLAHAEGYSSSEQSRGNYSSQSGYSSSSSTDNSNYVSQAVPEPKHKKHNKFSFSVDLPGQERFVVNEHGVHAAPAKIEWIAMHRGQGLPRHAVIGGGEAQGRQYVCRVNYNGLQPGKLYQGQCIIGYAGRQIPFSNYEILVSRKNLRWVSARNGFIPRGAITGGIENGRPLFICQADYRGGRHSGKVVGRNCNFAWGEGEISIPFYNVLVN